MRFKFEWLLLILTALSLSTANIVGYVRCKQDARSKIAAGLQGLVARTGMNASMGRALQSAAGADTRAAHTSRHANAACAPSSCRGDRTEAPPV